MSTPLPPLNLTGGAANPTTVGGNSSIAPFNVNFPSLQRPSSAKNSFAIGAGVIIALIGVAALLKKAK